MGERGTMLWSSDLGGPVYLPRNTGPGNGAGCPAHREGWVCTLGAEHSGAHIATGMPALAGTPLYAIWVD